MTPGSGPARGLQALLQPLAWLAAACLGCTSSEQGALSAGIASGLQFDFLPVMCSSGVGCSDENLGPAVVLGSFLYQCMCARMCYFCKHSHVQGLRGKLFECVSFFPRCVLQV